MPSPPPSWAGSWRPPPPTPRAFGKPVLLVHGDEHVQEVEPGYAGVPNLTRLETFGNTAGDWLRVTIDPRSPQVFSWQPLRIPAP